MEWERSRFERYQRQMMIDGWGEEAQQRLAQSVVFIAGAGGLGSPAAMYLAAAGIGKIRICDYDAVEITNLNRQILHDSRSVGSSKVFSAQRTLERINESAAIIPVEEKICDSNVERLVGDAGIIVDCMDNFPARYSLMKAAAARKIPLVYGSIWGMEGRLTFIHTPDTPCLGCIFPEAPQEERFPAAGAAAGVIGSLQAMEVLKYLTDIGENLKNRLLVWDGTNMEFRKFKVNRHPDCLVCGKG